MLDMFKAADRPSEMMLRDLKQDLLDHAHINYGEDYSKIIP
jgi:hypothetical protein